MHQPTSAPCPQFHLQLSVLHTHTDLRICQTSTWKHISKFSTCFWHNIMLSQKLPEIKGSVIKSIEVTIRKRNWKSKDLWLWTQVILDSYRIVFPKSDATGLPPASLRATKICYFSTCTTELSTSITKKNGSDYLLQKVVWWDTAYPHFLSEWPWKALQANILLKMLTYSDICFLSISLNLLFCSKMFSWRK